MGVNSPDSIFRRLRAELAREPERRAWEQLLQAGDVDYVLSASDLGDEQIEKLRFRDLIDAYHSLEGGPLRNAPTETTPDLRDSALARIVAAEATRAPDVKQFRRDTLRGKLLSPEKLEDWIERQASAEEEALRAFISDLRVMLVQRGSEEMAALELLAPLMLKYVVQGDEEPWVRRRRVAPGGKLDRLRLLARRLAWRYGWGEALAVTFALTGQAVPLSRSTVSVQRASVPHLERIALDLSPRLSPNEVRDLYARARAELRGPGFRDRPLSSEYLELAVFVAERNDGRASWQGLMADWNEAGFGRRYDNWKTFTGAARRAYQRVTGSRLEWRAGRKEEL